MFNVLNDYYKLLRNEVLVSGEDINAYNASAYTISGLIKWAEGMKKCNKLDREIVKFSAIWINPYKSLNVICLRDETSNSYFIGMVARNKSVLDFKSASLFEVNQVMQGPKDSYLNESIFHWNPLEIEIVEKGPKEVLAFMKAN